MKKGLMQVMMANIINLAIGLLNSFILPKYLSVETYAMIKTYTLYISYAGFFHLGYLDGMYLKYGGKKLTEVNDREYGVDFGNILFLESLAGVVLTTIAFVLHDSIILAFAFGMLLNNIISCFQMLFQAVGEFKLYSSALNFRSIVSFAGSVVLLSVFKCDDYIYYVACQVLSGTVPVIYLGVLLNRRVGFLKKIRINWSEMKENISSGFVLMLGNFSSTLFTGIGKWFVKILLTITDFAVYSFATSVDSLINVFITPIAITLYNSLCRERDNNRVKQLKSMVLIWGFIVAALAFPAKWIIEHFLTKYVDAVPIIIVLFTAQALHATIKGVYVNLYKAKKQQSIYFRQMVAMLIVATVLDVVMYLVFGNAISLAVAALITAFLWLVVNECMNSEIRFSVKEWIYLCAMVSAFIACGLCLPTVVGFIVYVVLALVFSMAFMRTAARFMISNIGGMIVRILKRGNI